MEHIVLPEGKFHANIRKLLDRAAIIPNRINIFLPTSMGEHCFNMLEGKTIFYST
jgi:hypothetical protein